MSRTCIVAIDFGTAYSGYAYILTVNHQEVQRVKRWERRAGADTAKTPTCILFDQNQDFMEFGYKAKDKYYEICKNTNTYFYFRDFKMELYKKKITKYLEIRDVNKKSMCAMKVFSAALRFLKEDALKTINKETQNMSTALDFTWVLTVPAIWDVPARHFMRDAAVQAGIDRSSHKLVIALESEAASVWCKQLSAEDFLLDTNDTVEVTMSSGTQYVVVDCGGGTIDITVHEVLKGGALKELDKASGNDKGGQTVDKKFTRCLRDFFCDGLWEEYERDHPKEFQQFMEDFIFFRESDHSHVRLLDFGERFKDMIEKRKKKSKYPLFTIADGMTFHLKPYSAKLEISERRMESFFHKTLGHITDHLSEILKKHKNIRYILLVGGLASSHMLREHVQREFRDHAKVLCPKNPQEAILKGAVMFGQDESVIRSRKSAFTYGFSKIMRFDPSKHKAQNKIVTDDGVWCRHLFRKMVEVNEDVEWNETREYSIYPLEGDQGKMSFDFYRTKKNNPMYVDERGVEGPVASCDVIMPRESKGMDHEVRLKIYFGSTTITAEAIDMESMSTASVKMDFRSQLPAFSSTPSFSDTPPGSPSNTPHGSFFSNGSSSRSSSTTHSPRPRNPPAPTSARPTLQHSFRLADGESSSSPRPSQQRTLRPGEIRSCPTTTRSPVRSNTVPLSSSHPSGRRTFRPADVEPPSTPTHPPMPSDQPAPTSTRPVER